MIITVLNYKNWNVSLTTTPFLEFSNESFYDVCAVCDNDYSWWPTWRHNHDPNHIAQLHRVQNLSALLREPGSRWKELIGQQCLNVEHGLARGRTNAWRSGGAAPLAGSYISSRVWCEQPQAAGGRHWRIEGGWRQMVRAPGWNCMSWEVKVLQLNFLLQKSTGDVCISLKLSLDGALLYNSLTLLVYQIDQNSEGHDAENKRNIWKILSAKCGWKVWPWKGLNSTNDAAEWCCTFTHEQFTPVILNQWPTGVFF